MMQGGVIYSIIMGLKPHLG